MTTALPKLEKLKPNPHWAKLPLFNRKNWTRVRFDDVVENLNETCDPAEAGLERVIAMEHLEPGSLHIRAWGNVADGTTFTRRCRPGRCCSAIGTRARLGNPQQGRRDFHFR